MVVIEFGCGNSKTEGAVGVDSNPLTQADIIHDMNIFPYPFESNYANKIICHNVLEHVDDFVAVMDELWRIAGPGCIFEVSGPFMSSVNYFSDPTHRRAFTSRSFDYFIKGTDAHNYCYSLSEFKLQSVTYDPDQLEQRKGVHRWILNWANRNKQKYEDRYAFLYPIYQIHFQLEVIK